MTKHVRSSSSSHNRYSNPMPVPLAASYSSPRLTIPTLPSTLQQGYYTTVPSQPSISAMQAAAQQQAYEAYGAMPMQPTVMSQQPPQHHQQQQQGPHRASSGAWTPQDDQTLLAARAQGLNWSQIQTNYFPGKSPNACRKRHERLMERKGADDWDNRKTERMAKEYMSMRKEIWSGLAAKTGEKWMVVEQKCLSAGLKNLQAHARAYTRRERMAAGQPLSPYDENTLALMTPVDELDASYSSPETASSASGGAGHSAGAGSVASSSAAYAASMHMAQMAGGGGGGGGPSGAGGYYQTAGPSGPAPHHGYTSSVSSTGTAAGSYGPAAAHSQDGSPYMGAHARGQRMPSSDMGIDAIINRPGGAQGQQQPPV